MTIKQALMNGYPRAREGFGINTLPPLHEDQVRMHVTLPHGGRIERVVDLRDRPTVFGELIHILAPVGWETLHALTPRRLP